ncbi:MAG: large subunit ribosomal protein L15 [Candidatus Woesearchaeota archaeon]|jgi:large subunit ribosomal protein L15
MTHNKRSKTSRNRGSWTHGYGEKKKHRGAGSRGGRGMAGTGKRADTKNDQVATNKKYFGKHGFHNPNTKLVNAINVRVIESNIESFIKKGFAKKDKDSYVVDLTKSPYNKLLGTGNISIPITVTVEYASEAAIGKVNKANGTVTVTSQAQ